MFQVGWTCRGMTQDIGAAMIGVDSRLGRSIGAPSRTWRGVAAEGGRAFTQEHQPKFQRTAN